MARRKKHPRLPNGLGSIRYLGRNRKHPYAVHPPATDTDDHGNYIRPKAICYVDDWYVGFAVLNAYRAGTYKSGDELLFKSFRPLASEPDLEPFCNRLLADFSAYRHAEDAKKESRPTFSDVYEQFFDWKYGVNAGKKLSGQSRSSTKAAFLNCSAIHNRVFEELRLEDLQACINSCGLKRSSLELIKSLLLQMYNYAEPRELCGKNYARFLTLPSTPAETHGIPFSDEELSILWRHQHDPTAEFLLIMCYSGYRITAYRNIDLNMQDWYFQGGVKTASGKNRIVPVHSAIRPLVSARMERDGAILEITTNTFRHRMDRLAQDLSITRHTPHDCRHTFSRLCEKYGVPDADRKRMMGHSFGADITNGVYGHRTLEELREQIEKIQVDL